MSRGAIAGDNSLHHRPSSIAADIVPFEKNVLCVPQLYQIPLHTGLLDQSNQRDRHDKYSKQSPLDFRFAIHHQPFCRSLDQQSPRTHGRKRTEHRDLSEFTQQFFG
jgi:hypothetical protein